MSLTKRQREILTYLSEYSEERGYAPSFEEIAGKFGYSSLATVHEHLSNLEKKGYIKREYNESRAIEVLPSEIYPRAHQLPLVGTVAAGLPIEAIETRGGTMPRACQSTSCRHTEPTTQSNTWGMSPPSSSAPSSIPISQRPLPTSASVSPSSRAS